MLFLAVTVLDARGAGLDASEGRSDWRHVERVIDGDTLVLDGGERVRLIGVDTPETVRSWAV